ncbi:unnamed protein product, partial [Mesorhabditis belari]|uniref:Uncharacterized protein n=1 Tax=Mesorhabditis belari TaxID=2138241 RepID=A0AAF3F420_9BILA
MYLLPNQSDRFDGDEFLHELRVYYQCKYSEIPHAQIGERRAQFRREFDNGRVRVTFNNGIAPAFCLSNERNFANGRFSIISEPFLFNGVLVIARGFIDENSLEGRVRIERTEPIGNVIEPSTAQLNEMDRLCALYDISSS